jgi:hypothetical protein
MPGTAGSYVSDRRRGRQPLRADGAVRPATTAAGSQAVIQIGAQLPCLIASAMVAPRMTAATRRTATTSTACVLSRTAPQLLLSSLLDRNVVVERASVKLA